MVAHSSFMGLALPDVRALRRQIRLMIPDPFIRDRGGDPDALEEGYFLLEMHRSGRVSVPIRIWFGPPLDEEGQPMERSWRWQIEINGVLFGDPDAPPAIAGRPIDRLDEFWPHCKRCPITAEDYRYRVDRANHAEKYDENDPFGGTGRRIDVLTAPLPDYVP